MNRKNFASISGIIVDVCKPHGIWLDHGELASALTFAETGGLVEARRREVSALEERKRRAEYDLPAGGGAFLDLDSDRRGDHRPIGGLLGWLANELLG
jgi:Zn-finger nucleic acid-binding protein